MSKKVLYITQEITPFVPETPISLIGRELPEDIQERGYEVRVFMPKWGIINERRGQLHEVIRLSGMNLIINDTDHPLIIKVASIPDTRIQVYFIDNDDYFSRRGMSHDAEGEDYPDNGERAVFFARGVLETAKKLRWMPDYIVCQGWVTAVVPLYLKTLYAEEPVFENAKVVTALYQQQIKGEFGKKFKEAVYFDNVDKSRLASYKDDFDFAELGKLAIDNADAVAILHDEANSTLVAHAKKKKMPLAKATDIDMMADACDELFKKFA